MNKKPIPNRFQSLIRSKSKYPFDNMKYEDSYIIPCEKKEAHRISNRVGAAARSRFPIDYKMTTKFVGEGVLVRKIKAVNKTYQIL